MADKNLRVNIILGMAEKVLGPLKRISQGSSETAQTLKAARDQLKQLNAQQAAVGNFEKHTQAMRESSNQLKVMQQNLQTLKSSGVASAAQIKKHESAIEKQTAKFKEQQSVVFKLRSHLTSLGITSVSSAQQRLGADIAATTARIKAQTDALKKQADMQQRVAGIKQAQNANVAARGQARGALLDGVALAATLGAPIKMAVDFESSMADVAKVMDFGADENGLAKLSQSAIDLSKTLPMAAKDIAQIMALGGQSGLSSAELLGGAGKVGFAEHAIKMGTAFGMTAEEAGTSMAKMKSAFGMSIPEVATLTDKINLLGNTGAANEKQILNIVTRVGPLGAVAGVASGEIAALGSTLAGMGVQEEVAATGIQNFMLALTSGASATKKQREMLKGLGLESTEVAKTMQTDATGTMLKVLESVKRLPKHEQAAALAEMFGKESIKAIAPMLTQLDTLKENFAKVNDATKYGGAVNTEYAARAATTANQLQLAKNQASAMGITLGSVMLPALNDTLKTIMPWIGQITALAQAYPGVTKAIVMGVAAIMLFKIAAIAGAYAFTFVRGAMLSVRAVLLAARMGWLIYTGALVASTATSKAAIVVSKGFAAAQWLMNAAMTANPIGMLVVAIGLLVVAGVMLWRNWDQVVAGAKALWQDLFTWMGGLFTRMSNWLGGIWQSVSAAMQAPLAALVAGVRNLLTGGVAAWMQALLNFSPLGILWNAITGALSALGVQVPQQFRNFGSYIVDGIIGGITDRLGALRDAVMGAASSAAGWFKEKLGIASPSKVFTQFGGWISEGAAKGIDAGQAGVRAASVALAGVAMLPVAQAQSGSPAAATPVASIAPIAPRAGSSAAAPAAMGGNTYQFTIHAAPGQDAQAIARAVAAELDRRDRAAGARRKSSLHDID